MILSMTGFGRGTAVRNGREITVELRSVNSRYFEYSSRIPRTCSYLDSRLKKQLNERISRGKVELSMTVQNVDAADTVVAVNMELARSYQQAMRDISEQLGVKNDISAGVLTRFPDVLTTRHADVDEEQLWEDVSAVTAQALDRFVVDHAPLSSERQRYPSITISTLVFIIYLTDSTIYCIVFSRRLKCLKMIVKRASGYPGNTQQLVKRIMLP